MGGELGLVAVEVDQLVVGDVTEVAIDVVVGPDADERRPVTLNLNPDVAEDLVRGPVDLVHAEVDVLCGDRVAGAYELLAIRVEVTVIAGEGVRGQQGDAAEQQRQADQPADAGEDHADHAACGPVRSRPSWARGRVRGRTLLAVVRHQAKPTGRQSCTLRLTGLHEKSSCCLLSPVLGLFADVLRYPLLPHPGGFEGSAPFAEGVPLPELLALKPVGRVNAHLDLNAAPYPSPTEQFRNYQEVTFVVEHLVERYLELLPYGTNGVHPRLRPLATSVHGVDARKGARRSPFHIGRREVVHDCRPRPPVERLVAAPQIRQPFLRHRQTLSRAYPVSC